LPISLRGLIAPMVLKMPCAIAQAPMKMITTNAVMPGHRPSTGPLAGRRWIQIAGRSPAAKKIHEIIVRTVRMARSVP
jgi:hypothetical protein